MPAPTLVQDKFEALITKLADLVEEIDNDKDRTKEAEIGKKYDALLPELEKLTEDAVADGDTLILKAMLEVSQIYNEAWGRQYGNQGGRRKTRKSRKTLKKRKTRKH